MIAVGGWNMASAPFSAMVATAGSREEFATSTVKFLRDHGFDGLDIDWEYPAARGSPASDKQKYVELVKVKVSHFRIIRKALFRTVTNRSGWLVVLEQT